MSIKKFIDRGVAKRSSACYNTIPSGPIGTQQAGRQRVSSWRAGACCGRGVSRAQIHKPPLSNRGVQIAIDQPLYKVQTLTASWFNDFQRYVKIEG